MEVYTGMKEKSTELAQKRAEASIERREEILSHRNIVHERIAQAFPAAPLRVCMSTHSAARS